MTWKQWRLQGGFLETSQAPTIAYSTIQLARYSLGATRLGLIADALTQHWRQVQSANLTLELLCTCSIDDVIIMNMIKCKIFAETPLYFLEILLWKGDREVRGEREKGMISQISVSLGSVSAS